MIDWRAILAEHGPTVWRIVFRILNHHADALDCYQETFLAAYGAAGRQTIGNWASFLSTLATRRAIDRLRQRIRARRRFCSIDSITEPVSEADSPIELAHAAERLDCVRAALTDLPEKQAQVFWLSCIEGLSNQEISEQMQISAGEIRVLLHRARTRLRQVLANPLPEGRKCQ